MTPDNRHQHIIVRAEITKPPVSKNDCASMDAWIKQLVKDIDMKILFGPQSIYCEVEGNRGMTSFAIIETSHICIHTWDECVPAVMQVDVYTCSELDPNVVFAALEIFEPSKIEYKFLDRETALTQVTSGKYTK